MLSKLLSFFTAILLMICSLLPAEPEKQKAGEVLKEQKPESGTLRTFNEINGINGSVFYIERPGSALNTVSGESFGLSSENADNFEQLRAAIAYLKANPGTRLQLQKGVYYLNNTSSLGLNGIHDAVIDGGGATLVFSNVTVGIEITGCDCVELRSLNFDWDWEKLPLSDIVVVSNADPKKGVLDFVFPEREQADENTIISAVSQCDPETLTYGAKYSNKEVYVYQDPSMIRSVKKAGANVLRIEHNGCFKSFENGDTFIMRHYVYDSTFAVINGGSSNITFDSVSLFGFPGAGFYAGGKANHFQIINSYIGVEPGMEKTRHTSLGADAIHIVNSDGCFNISGNDISGQGDDALNVHDGLGCVDEVSGQNVKVTGNAVLFTPGSTLGFFDEGFNLTDITASVVSDSYDPAATCHTLVFDRSLDGLIRPGFIAYSLDCMSDNYVVKNNYFHENRARGLLLQSPNGLCEGNRFYKTEMQAIKVIMDISHGLWYEGTGVDSLDIVNNSFEMCDYIATGEVITVGTNIDGRPAESMPFSNIRICSNTFTEFPCRVLSADNANGLTFSGNKINAGSLMPKRAGGERAFFGRHCCNIDFSGNDWSGSLLGSIAKTETAEDYIRINGKKD